MKRTLYRQKALAFAVIMIASMGLVACALDDLDSSGDPDSDDSAGIGLSVQRASGSLAESASRRIAEAVAARQRADGSIGTPGAEPRGEGHGNDQDSCVGGTDTLEEYARKCTRAMDGVALEDFDCDDPDATEPGGQGATYGGESSGVHCNTPNVLNHECDPGSKFHVLHRNEGGDGIYTVAHCRKKGHAASQFGDIAVIQYNSKSGATCFYQALGTLDGHVKAPSKGLAAYPWKSPADTAAINCVHCHDNGPLVRSPYLAQFGEVWPASRTTHDHNYLPGTLGSDVYSWNSGLMPYEFIGSDFQSWKAYSITSAKGSLCTSCHRMGLGQSKGGFPSFGGTSHQFGLEATADMGDPNHQQSKLPHGPYVEGVSSPIWMTPGSTVFDGTKYDAAKAIKRCADEFANGQPLDPDCHAYRFARGDTCGPPIEVVINGGTKADDPKSWEGTWEVPLGCKDSPDCPPGFYYWTTLHGPFYQNSPFKIPIDDPTSFFGSYVRITAKDHQWVLQGRLNAKDMYDPTKPGPGGPGGTVGGIPFSKIQSIPYPYKSYSVPASISDPTGATETTSITLGSPAKATLSILSGFIGNVARESEMEAHRHNREWGDRLMVTDQIDTLLTQTHDPSNPANGWFTGEAWVQGIPSWKPDPFYLAHEIWSGSGAGDDVQLVSAADAKRVICFITGIRGDWSKTRPDGSGGTAQPYAEIYTGAGGDIRLRAFPHSSEADGVSAYASCLLIK